MFRDRAGAKAGPSVHVRMFRGFHKYLLNERPEI